MIRKEKPDCKTCLNDNCFIKKHIHNPKMADYVDEKHTIVCKKTQQFIIEGSPVHGLFFIYKGKAKTVKTGINGKEQIVRLTRNGDTLGFRGFGTSKRYLVGGYALEDTILCNFTTDTLMKIFNHVPEFTYDMMLFYAEELNKSENNVRKIAHMSVRERVIDTLLYINRKFGQSDGFLNIELSRREISDFAGTTEEQVIRMLSSFKKEGLIKTSGKKLGIIKPEVLRKEIVEHKYMYK